MLLILKINVTSGILPRQKKRDHFADNHQSTYLDSAALRKLSRNHRGYEGNEQFT
jgi:hypothetical protein